jgi:hypothetical protein
MSNVFNRNVNPNVSWKIHPDDLKKLTKELRQLGHIISDPNMQLYRANKYREFTINMVERGMLDLQPLAELSIIISGSHAPEYVNGSLVREMGVKPVGKNAAEAGYWDNDSSIVPGRGRQKISYARLAVLTHSGFRVRLQGDVGNRVRAWFRLEHGINFKASTRYLYIPPRPFLYMSYNEYMASGMDVQACSEFLDRMVNSPIDTTVGSAARKAAKE